MKLLKLKAENLFSLGKVEISLQEKGLILVSGYSIDESSANGSGKSTVANKSILWTLFGETAGGLKANEVINRHTKKKCWGEISFISTLGTNSDAKYTIRRERPAKLSLFKDDKDISATTAKVTQELINKALGFNFKTFLQTSVQGQGKILHYPSLSSKDQKSVLEQILPMEQIDNWATIADREYKSLKPKVDEKLQEFNRIEERAITLEEQLKQCEQDGIRFEESRKKSINKAKLELENIKKKFEPEWNKLNQFKKETDAINLNEIEDSIAHFKLVIENNKSLYDRSKSLCDNAGCIGNEWKFQLATSKKQREEIDTNTKCPVCLRDYDTSTINAVKMKLQQHDQKIEEADASYKKCIEASKYYCQEMQKYEKEINTATANVESLQQLLLKRNEYDQKKQLLGSKIEAAEASAKSQLLAAENSENPHKAVFLRLQQELSESRKNKKKIKKEHNTLKEELGHLLYWREIYGKELKLKLFEDVCPFLDARTEYHLSSLKNSQLHCKFSTIKRLSSGDTKEDFNVIVWSDTGGKGFESLSGGEQQIINFAIGLSLADLASHVTGRTSSFMILDEPLTELDAKNSEAVVEYLTTEISKTKDTIFLISNEETLKGLVPNRIHIVKSNGVSNVVSE